ncbi:MAG: hypothetical protein ACLVCU_01195 [Gallintestinimicrobium sp.]|uniref:hypothetical protein n=1 Tax=Gallintestinimicrobium sp. TaxID=2981655 RepID=UPI0039996272
MAKQVLPTNFMDDILNESMNGKRRWIITQNDDGTYTFEDATTYDQLGNTFGQAQVNEMNKAINESVDQARVIDDYKTLAAVNQNGFVPGAKPVAQLISDLGGLSFGQDADGNWGYKIGGADTVVPFKGELDFDYEHNVSIPYVVAAGNPNVLHYYTMTEEDAAYSYLALFAVTAGSVVSIELSGVSGPSIVCNKPGGNYSFALIANPVLNGKVNFRHGGTGDGHVFKLMIK